MCRADICLIPHQVSPRTTEPLKPITLVLPLPVMAAIMAEHRPGPVHRQSAMEEAMIEVQEQQRYLMEQIKLATYSPTGGETIPLIDIGPSFSGSKEARQAVADKIGAACRDIGFFQITNHGVSLAAREGVLEQARRFFHDLPLAEKQKLHIEHSEIFHGWEPSGYTNVNPDDWTEDGVAKEESSETKECYNFGYEESFDPTGGDGKYVEMDGSAPPPGGGNAWPSEDDLPGFVDGIRTYYRQVTQIQNF
jgi:hypothetical protein